jgi:ElaB/YqjD/DUF883 family membrane-anchored ribosome-binding protein
MSSGSADRGDNPIIGGNYGGTQTSQGASDYGQRVEQARSEAQDTAEQARDEAEKRTHEMTDQAGQKAEQARNEAQGKMDEGKQRAEQGKEQAASGIGKAAEQVRNRTQEQGGAAGQVGEMVAGQLDKTSQYLHQHDTDEMLHDFQEYVRKHPIQAVAGATITGFFLARILT